MREAISMDGDVIPGRHSHRGGVPTWRNVSMRPLKNRQRFPIMIGEEIVPVWIGAGDMTEECTVLSLLRPINHRDMTCEKAVGSVGNQGGKTILTEQVLYFGRVRDGEMTRDVHRGRRR